MFNDNNAEADEFCAATIEDILTKRTTDIVVDDDNKIKDEKESTNNDKHSFFSKATFVASDAAAGIDMNDRDFWAKILPLELNAKDMLAQLTLDDDDEDMLVVDDKRLVAGNKSAIAEFWSNLETQVKQVFDEQEMEETKDDAKHTTTTVIIHLLIEVCHRSDLFSHKQRLQAQDWANTIENPSQRKSRNKRGKYARQTAKRRSNLNEMGDADLRNFYYNEHSNGKNKNKKNKLENKQKSSITVYNTLRFNQRQVSTLITLFFDAFATTSDSFFPIIVSQFNHIFNNSSNINSVDGERTLREICGWTYALVLYLVGNALDKNDRNVFLDMKYLMMDGLFPMEFDDELIDNKSKNERSFDDNKQCSDEDIDINHSLKSDFVKNSNAKHPKNVIMSDFPSIDEKWFERLIGSKMRMIAKRMRLAIALRDILKNRKKEIEIPEFIGGELPVEWWDAECDQQLVRGAAIHGVCKWQSIRQDFSLVFMKKCMMSASVVNENSNHMSIDNDMSDDDDEDIEGENVSGYKCCGSERMKELMVHCCKCKDVLHGECCEIYSAAQISETWLCFECTGSWPKNRILYDRLAAVLHAIRKQKL